MNISTVLKKFIHLQGEIERISFVVGSSKQLVQDGAYPEYMDTVREATRLMEKATVSLRELVPEIMYIEKKELMYGVANILGITIVHNGYWYKIEIPALLPNKHAGISCMFIEAPLRYMLDRYIRENKPERLRECVICFRHIYHPDFPERAIRDHDNIETKKVQDTVADKLIVDDTGVYCSNFHVTQIGEKDSTEIYVVPVKSFPEWLNNYPIKEAQNG